MNSLEFIDQEIISYKHLVTFSSNDRKKYYEECVLLLQQIKTILEAWEVVNEEFIIKPYYQQGKYPAIMIRHPIEDDEFVRRGVKQEKYNIVEKALEVEDDN